MKLLTKYRNDMILWLFLLGYVIVWPLLYYLVPSLNTTQNRITVELVVAIICLILYSTGYIFGKRYHSDGSEEHFGNNSRKKTNVAETIALIIISAFIGVLLYYAATFVNSVIQRLVLTRFPNLPELPVEFDPNVSPLCKNLYLFGGIILGPITEEIVFRKLLYRKIAALFPSESTTLPIVLNSIIFAACHIVGYTLGVIIYHRPIMLLYKVLFYILPGIVFQIMYNKTQDVKTSAVMHMVYNFMCIWW